MESTHLGKSAYGKWRSNFEQILQDSAEVLPKGTRSTLSCKPPRAFSGIFSVTPDGLPLVGPTDCKGLYCAVAIWVTHAYGARILADMLSNESEKSDQWIVDALDPTRFTVGDPELLKSKAAATYNDVYNKAARR